MSWKQRISVVALVVLAAVPVSGVLCAMVCGSSAETGSAHHGSRAAEQCDEPAPSSTGVHIEGAAEHDCSGHAGLTPLGTAAAERIRSHVAPALSTPSRDTTLHFVPATGPVFESTKPPGSAPPTIPLVLRV